MEQREGKIFNLKPELTTAMKLAASFAITYYGLLFIFEIITIVFRRQIFRKKNNGKALFVGASLLLIIFQLITTGVVPMMKYALEVLLVIIIAPIRVKKRIRIKGGKDQATTTTEQQPITTQN